MREIKFRAWVPADHWINKSGKGEYIYDWQDKTYVDSCGFNPCEDGIVIEQFTGRHDKNGREIYEGDILKMENQPHETGVIEFSGNGYWLKDEFANYIPSESMCAVIGNIHENPELLP